MKKITLTTFLVIFFFNLAENFILLSLFGIPFNLKTLGGAFLISLVLTFILNYFKIIK